jgi:hypothetical protein
MSSTKITKIEEKVGYEVVRIRLALAVTAHGHRGLQAGNHRHSATTYHE